MKIIPALLIFIALNSTEFAVTVKSQIPTSGEIILTKNGAWCWFQDPRAVYVKNKKTCTYAQWITNDGKLQTGAFNHKTGEITVSTIKNDWDADDHNVGAFLVLPDRRLMIFYARHNGKGIYCRTSTRPEDITSWNEEITISESSRITYAHPVYLSKEKKYFVFWRGPSWKPNFATSSNGKNWSKSRILIQDSGRIADDIRPYTKITSDGKSTIHFAFTDGHPRVEPQNSVYYLKYKNGKFYKADDTVAGDIDSLPVAHSESDLVYNGKTNDIRAWVWDIALDKKGYPVIAYSRLPNETCHYYFYARWNGRNWVDTEITPAGKWFPETPPGKTERESYYSGGIAIDHSNPSVVYLSKQVNGNFEIEKWVSPDRGKSWNFAPVTQHSGELNVRPVVPRGYKGNKDLVLWMFGNYEHYTRFNTGIKLYMEE